MESSAQTDAIRWTGILPERLARKASRSDFYFRPDLWVAGLVTRVEKVLEEEVGSGDTLMRQIGRHMVFGHAKRLRPLFVLLAQNLFMEETSEVTIDCAAAAELIHCASLFHDDVIDGAELRKGRRAANAVWGNKSAVIMGDHFFVLAYNLVTKHRDLRLIQLYLDMCSSLAEGVMMEIKNLGNLDTTEETHFETIKRKTAVFFRASTVVGGHIGGAPPELEDHLAGFGLNFGLAFQLSDDLLDLFSDPEATGKPRGSDLRSGIYTIPVIHALAETADFAPRFRPILEDRDLSSEDIDRIADALRSNGAMEYARGLVQRHSEAALAHLDRLPQGRSNDTLRDLLLKIVSREY